MSSAGEILTYWWQLAVDWHRCIPWTLLHNLLSDCVIWPGVGPKRLHSLWKNKFISGVSQEMLPFACNKSQYRLQLLETGYCEMTEILLKWPKTKDKLLYFPALLQIFLNNFLCFVYTWKTSYAFRETVFCFPWNSRINDLMLWIWMVVASQFFVF